MGEQVGYAALVERILGTRLRKTERITDWGRRPLSGAQVEYALSDVRYLLPIREHLDRELGKLHRRDWLAEELSFYEDPDTWRVDQSRIHTRVSGWRTLNRRNLAVLRELALWREETAARRDVPRNRVAGDDVLIEISLRRPSAADDLRPLRRLHPRELAQSAALILAAVERGMRIPEQDLPVPIRGHREDPEHALLADLMAVLLRKRAREHRIAPSYLGNQKSLLELVGWLSGPREEPSPPLLSGWRRRLVGDDLVSLFEGKTTLRVDPGTGSVITENGEPPASVR
jgi:ribonuclease D